MCIHGLRINKINFLQKQQNKVILLTEYLTAMITLVLLIFVENLLNGHYLKPTKTEDNSVVSFKFTAGYVYHTGTDHMIICNDHRFVSHELWTGNDTLLVDCKSHFCLASASFLLKPK